MTDARLEHDWDVAAELLCLIDNRLRSSGSPSTPDQWHPIRLAEAAAAMPRVKASEAVKLWRR